MSLFDGDYKMTQVEQLEADWGRVAADEMLDAVLVLSAIEGKDA